MTQNKPSLFDHVLIWIMVIGAIPFFILTTKKVVWVYNHFNDIVFFIYHNPRYLIMSSPIYYLIFKAVCLIKAEEKRVKDQEKKFESEEGV